MNEWRARHLEERERKDVEIFEKIKDDPNACVDDLWTVSGKRFIEWRKLVSALPSTYFLAFI